MSVRTLATDVSFLLCCSATVCSCDVLFLLGFGLDLSLFFLWPAFRAAFESNAAQDNSINVVSSMTPSNSPVRGRTKERGAILWFLLPLVSAL